MPVTLDEMTVYPIGEALEAAGLSRATFFRWLKQGRCKDARFKDRNGYRVFTPEEVEALRKAAQSLTPNIDITEAKPLRFQRQTRTS